MCVISYVRRGCFKEEEERRRECGSFYVLTTRYPAMFTVFVIYCYVFSNERVNYRIYISTDVEDVISIRLLDLLFNEMHVKEALIT